MTNDGLVVLARALSNAPRILFLSIALTFEDASGSKSSVIHVFRLGSKFVKI